MLVRLAHCAVSEFGVTAFAFCARNQIRPSPTLNLSLITLKLIIKIIKIAKTNDLCSEINKIIDDDWDAINGGLA